MIKMHFFPEKCKFYQKVCKIKKKLFGPNTLPYVNSKKANFPVMNSLNGAYKTE